MLSTLAPEPIGTFAYRKAKCAFVKAMVWCALSVLTLKLIGTLP